MTSAQLFVCVNDLIEDQQSAGASEARWFQAIRDASDFLQKEIGWFIPVKATRKWNGKGSVKLFVDPLLSVTSIANDGTALSASDYILNPNGKHWEEGPYTWLTIDPDATSLSAWADEEEGVVIAGLWGKFSRQLATGATVGTTQSAGASTLAVNDGGKVSPGMVILLGDEQELVTGWDDPTTNVTALNGAITATDDVLTLDSGSAVKRGEIIRLDFEQMKVRDIRNNQVSVIRNWNGSGAVLHTDNTQVDVYRTVTVERAVNGTDAAEHTSSTAVSRYAAPDDIQFLTRQIATLMLNKAKSGYQGRTGNAEMGTVFYNDAFPRFEIERVASNYYLPMVR